MLYQGRLAAMESLLDSEIKREEVKKGPLHNSKVGQILASRDAGGSSKAKSARFGDDFTPAFYPQPMIPSPMTTLR
jgi:hypothetical protein